LIGQSKAKSDSRLRGNDGMKAEATARTLTPHSSLLRSLLFANEVEGGYKQQQEFNPFPR
jgi:hypothetical protein